MHMREYQSRPLYALNDIVIAANNGGDSEIPTNLKAEEIMSGVIPALSEELHAVAEGKWSYHSLIMIWKQRAGPREGRNQRTQQGTICNPTSHRNTPTGLKDTHKFRIPY